MKRSLRKTTAGVSVTYSNGGYSNNLAGTDFAVEESEDFICLSINLAGNLHVRNKESNCYYDACELAERYSTLKSIQINEKQVIDGLAAAYRRVPNASLKLEVALGEKGAFKYSVEPRESNGSIFLDVRSDV
jgi:hypothetical protein